MMTTSASSNTLDPANVAAVADTFKKFLDQMTIPQPSSTQMTVQTKKDVQQNNKQLFHIMLHGGVDNDDDNFSVQKIINLQNDNKESSDNLTRNGCVADLTRYLVESVCPGILLKSIISKASIANEMKKNNKMILNIQYGMQRETTMMIVPLNSGIPDEQRDYPESVVSMVLSDKQTNASSTGTSTIIVDPQDNLYHRLCIAKQSTLMDKDDDLPPIINFSLRSYLDCNLFFNHNNLDQTSIPFSHRYLQVVVTSRNNLTIRHLKYFPTLQLLKRAKPAFYPSYVSDLGNNNNDPKHKTTSNRNGFKRKKKKQDNNTNPPPRKIRRLTTVRSVTENKPKKLKSSQSTPKKSTTPKHPPPLGASKSTPASKSKKSNASTEQSLNKHKKQNSQSNNNLTNNSITKSKEDYDNGEHIELSSDLANLKQNLLGITSDKTNNLIPVSVPSNGQKVNPFMNTKLYNEGELSTMTVSQLKKICADKFVPVSGKKSQIIERILKTSIPGVKLDGITTSQNATIVGSIESKLSAQKSPKDDDQTSRPTSKSQKSIETPSMDPKSKMPRQSTKTLSSTPKSKKSSSSATKIQQPKQSVKTASTPKFKISSSSATKIQKPKQNVKTASTPKSKKSSSSETKTQQPQQSPEMPSSTLKSKKSIQTSSSETNIDAQMQNMENAEPQESVEATSSNKNNGVSTQTASKTEKRKPIKKRKKSSSIPATDSPTKKKKMKKKISHKEDTQVKKQKDSSKASVDDFRKNIKNSSLDDLNVLSKPKLKDFCKINDLLVGGTKADLVERIWNQLQVERKKDESKKS